MSKIKTNSSLARALMGIRGSYAQERLNPYKDTAVKISVEWLEGLSEIKKKEIQLRIEWLFIRWSHEQGTKLASSNIENFKTIEIVDSFYNELKTMEPWEHFFSGQSTPIDLFEYLWISGFPDREKSIKSEEYLNGLAWLILFSEEKNNPAFLDSIIRAGLRLADFMFSQKKAESNTYYKIALKYGEPAFKQKKILRNNNLVAIEKTKPKKAATQSLATMLLEKGKPKSEIIGIIKSTSDYDIRTIRRHLEDHPSGCWKPRAKKK